MQPNSSSHSVAKFTAGAAEAHGFMTGIEDQVRKGGLLCGVFG
jgi:hypothetical protein